MARWLPGATLGVLGGGQLGRMWVHAAQRLGYRCVVLDPDAQSPAGAVADVHLRAAYDDADALAQLAQQAQAITTEFENVPAQTLRALAQSRSVAPGADAVAVCQDRALEKAHFGRCGVPCAPHAVLQTEADLARVSPTLLPGVLKTCTLGYDGKGQRQVRNAVELRQAWRELGGLRCVLEQRLALAAELSVVLARGHDGSLVHFAPMQNLHRDGILALTLWPAPDVPPAAQAQAVQAASAIAESLRYVGVMCVEFFLLDDGRIAANEMAPRPHNSGHCTIDACDCSQFEWQVRAMAGLPLTPPRAHSAAAMLNLLGDLWGPDGVPPPWHEALALPGVHLHLYGKTEARRARKMGHLTVTADRADDALRIAREAARRLGLPLSL
ncbi:MAG: 5-(carboxyamino)imidazole ribonucleotide synthase [Burkholderiaceae bacterium]|nr:5-(carboxyamino)imidazole ribonucleotide synthase [Burkholderiaceae bacterium]